jgi:alpha-ketoglutarate-dependent taurine dioxygenase
MKTPNEDIRLKMYAASRRQAVRLSKEPIGDHKSLSDRREFPLIISPSSPGADLLESIAGSREEIREKTLLYGAILFRGFNVLTIEGFEQIVQCLSDRSIEYRERTSPRSHIQGGVYTSTDYPAEYSIFPHNESSYSWTVPMKLFFYCMEPALKGGETPIVDCRKLLQRISPERRERFMERGWMYVRNFEEGFGLTWQTVFQTDDRGKLEEYCRQADIRFEWKGDSRLRTWQVRPAIAKHPQTGDLVWFNHAAFFHVSTLDPRIREGLLEEFEEIDLPNNTYYGDGSPIEPSVLDELRAAYTEEMVSIPWRKGDLLIVDNMLTAHARSPFTGRRKILVAMAEPFDRRTP